MKTTHESAEAFFSEFYHGKHQIPVAIKAYGNGWSVNHRGCLSTFDCGELTRLVFLAHDKCMRVELIQDGPLATKIVIWQRERKGSISKRHPTLGEAVARWREHYPKEEYGQDNHSEIE